MPEEKNTVLPPKAKASKPEAPTEHVEFDEEDVGKKINQLRLAKGFSQRKLARMAGLTNTSISAIERNKVSPAINTLKAILNVLARYPVGDLIQQAIQAGFVTGLEDLEGKLTLLSTLSPLEAMRSSSFLDAYRIAGQTGQNGQERH